MDDKVETFIDCVESLVNSVKKRPLPWVAGSVVVNLVLFVIFSSTGGGVTMGLGGSTDMNRGEFVPAVVEQKTSKRSGFLQSRNEALPPIEKSLVQREEEESAQNAAEEQVEEERKSQESAEQQAAFMTQRLEEAKQIDEAAKADQESEAAAPSEAAAAQMPDSHVEDETASPIDAARKDATSVGEATSPKEVAASAEVEMTPSEAAAAVAPEEQRPQGTEAQPPGAATPQEAVKSEDSTQPESEQRLDAVTASKPASKPEDMPIAAVETSASVAGGVPLPAEASRKDTEAGAVDATAKMPRTQELIAPAASAEPVSMQTAGAAVKATNTAALATGPILSEQGPGPRAAAPIDQTIASVGIPGNASEAAVAGPKDGAAPRMAHAVVAAPIEQSPAKSRESEVESRPPSAQAPPPASWSEASVASEPTDP